MNEDTYVINIGRQLGSGGRVIGAALAKEFGIKFYDKELLDLAARESGFRKELFERSDEHKGWLRSTFSLRVPLASGESWYGNQLSDESLFKFQSDAILKAAAEGSCLFVGRCADYVLRNKRRCANIFIAADMDDRVRHVAEMAGISAEEAAKKISHIDEKRASYYNYYTGGTWGAAATYHLCINSSVLGIEETTAYIKEFIMKKLEIKR